MYVMLSIAGAAAVAALLGYGLGWLCGHWSAERWYEQRLDSMRDAQEDARRAIITRAWANNLDEN